jgi:hypothetical protein
MIKITFPDGAVREYNSGVTALEIARSISEGLARKVLAANVNGQVWDATRPITNDATLTLLTWTDKDGKSTFWHSSAHLMAEAVESLFPGVKFWVGPAIENPQGFYYDMDLGGRQITEDDLRKLEAKMAELAKRTRLTGARRSARPRRSIFLPKKAMNTSWTCWKTCRTGILPFMRRGTSPTSAGDPISRIPGSLRRSG